MTAFGLAALWYFLFDAHYFEDIMQQPCLCFVKTTPPFAFKWSMDISDTHISPADKTQYPARPDPVRRRCILRRSRYKRTVLFKPSCRRLQRSPRDRRGRSNVVRLHIIDPRVLLLKRKAICYEDARHPTQYSSFCSLSISRC